MVCAFALIQTTKTSHQGQHAGILFTARARENVLIRAKFVTSTPTVPSEKMKASSAVSGGTLPSFFRDVNGKVLLCAFVGGELSAGVLKLHTDLLEGYNPFALAVLKFRSVINC